MHEHLRGAEEVCSKLRAAHVVQDLLVRLEPLAPVDVPLPESAIQAAVAVVRDRGVEGTIALRRCGGSPDHEAAAIASFSTLSQDGLRRSCSTDPTERSMDVGALAEGRQATQRLLAIADLPPDVAARATQNAGFYG